MKPFAEAPQVDEGHSGRVFLCLPIRSPNLDDGFDMHIREDSSVEECRYAARWRASDFCTDGVALRT